jgi:hypothetical protein
MSENFDACAITYVEVIAVSPKTLGGQGHGSESHVVALVTPAKLKARKANASVEDIEAFGGREKPIAERAFPRLNGRADESVVVKQLRLNAKGGGKRVRRHRDGDDAFGGEKRAVVRESTKGEEKGHHKPRHEGPPLSEDTTGHDGERNG